jgi:hypothetical protein
MARKAGKKLAVKKATIKQLHADDITGLNGGTAQVVPGPGLTARETAILTRIRALSHGPAVQQEVKSVAEIIGKNT